jgi:hypothetical protein
MKSLTYLHNKVKEGTKAKREKDYRYYMRRGQNEDPKEERIESIVEIIVFII